MRKKRLFYNTVTAIINQVIALVCGFILPRQIILAYGSEINGLVSSITQFLGVITLLEMGVGAVVQSALYPALASKDNKYLSQIIVSSNKFFNAIGVILIVYTGVLCFLYPVIVGSPVSYISTIILILSIAVSSIAQYLIGVTNQLLLNADQRSYIQLVVQTGTTLMNTIVSVVLIFGGFPITIVKLGSSIVLLLRPIVLNLYVKRHYLIDYKIKYDTDPIEQKWNAIAQHIATFVVDRTDAVVLTLLSTLTNVSIYYIYHLVVQGLYQSFNVVTTGVQSLLGDMYAKKEIEKFSKTYGLLEWTVHTTVTLIFTCCGLLIVPFVMVYTKGVTDADYAQPLFGTVMSIAFAFCCLRSYYNMIIKAVSHYKQTQKSAIIEAIINIVVSIVLVWKFGLVGVAIGTLGAMGYRTFSFVIHIHRSILNVSHRAFGKQLLVDFISVTVYILSTFYIRLDNCSYLGWGVMALKVFAVCLAECVLTNLLLYPKELYTIIGNFKRKTTQRK